MNRIKAVDFFCGAGGFSMGAIMSGCGFTVMHAANHNELACKSHAKNHPGTQVHCENLHHFNFNKLPSFDIGLYSPSCQGLSDSRGIDQPRHDIARLTPGIVVDSAEICRPHTIVVENVPEMVKKWCRFKAWKLDLELLGYDVSVNIVNAAKFRVPQDRERAIIVATLDRRAPVIVEPNLPERTAIEVIDFTKGKWNPIAGYVERTRKRVARARSEGFGDRFVCPYYSSGSGLTGRSLDRPIGTITTLDRWLVVDGDMGRVLTVAEIKEFMSFPKDYWLAGTRRDQIMMLGNAIPPLMAAEILRQVVN